MKRTAFRIDEKQVLEIFCSEAYFSINKNLLKLLGPNTAIFFSNIMDRYRIKTLTEENFSEWFSYDVKKQSEDTGLSLHELRNCRNICISLGMIEVQRRGNPSKFFYKPHIQQCLKICKTSVTEFKTLEFKNFKHYINNINIINNNNNSYNNCPGFSTPADDSNKKPSTKERSKTYLPLAKYLSTIIKQTKDIEHTSHQLIQWSNEFRRLSEGNKVSIPRIKKVLKWYKDHVGGEYIPVIESGASFRTKFIKLEDAIKRENNPKPNSKIPSNAYRTGKFKARKDDIVI